MKPASTLFLKITLLTIGMFVLFLCLYAIPTFIGDITLDGYDPILIGLYMPAIPFFCALFNAFILLKNIEKEKAFSSSTISSLRSIKLCAVLISVLFTLGMPYVFSIADQDDAPGVVAIASLILLSSIVIAAFASLLQKLFENAVKIKTENDLTV